MLRTDLAISIAHQDELVQQLALGIQLRHNLPVDEQQLLQGLIIHGHHEADDGLRTCLISKAS